MLNLNQGETINTNGSDSQRGQENAAAPNNLLWKVLIFDKFGQDIISSIMRVNDLRENGVTVHMYALLLSYEQKSNLHLNENIKASIARSICTT